MKNNYWAAVMVMPEHYTAVLAATRGTQVVPFLLGQEALARRWEEAGGGLSALVSLLQPREHGAPGADSPAERETPATVGPLQ